MSSDTPLLSNFLAPANPLFDLKRVIPTPKYTPDLIPLSFRETLLDQPPLGPNERLPMFLALKEGELAISTAPQPSYVHVPELDVFIPVRHEMMVQLVRMELTNTEFTTTHGSPDTVAQGCSGPLCRRTRSAERAETAKIRQQRLGYRTRQPTHTRAKVVPQYVAVDPLLEAFTILAHKKLPPSTQLTKIQKVYRTLNNMQQLISYLKIQYPEAVL